MFEKFLSTTCPDFQSELKLVCNQWVKDLSAVDEDKVIAKFINLYTNFKANGECVKNVVNKDSTIIVLVTALKAAKEAAATPTQ